MAQLIDPGLIRQARFLDALTERLRAHLPAAIAQHCWVSGCRDRKLTVITDSAAYGVTVRYQQRAILNDLNDAFSLEPGLAAVNAKVRKVDSPWPAPARRRARAAMSAPSARQIAETAAHVPDVGLANALRRLAQRATADEPGSSGA